MTINALDEKIIKILGKNARLSSEKLAKQIGISPTTIRRRLKALVRKGIVRNMPLVDAEKLGLTIQAIIGMKVDNAILGEAAEKLASNSDIKWLATTDGRYDMVAMTAFTSLAELSEFKKNLPTEVKGIKDIELFVCLDVKKGKYVTLD